MLRRSLFFLGGPKNNDGLNSHIDCRVLLSGSDPCQLLHVDEECDSLNQFDYKSVGPRNWGYLFRSENVRGGGVRQVIQRFEDQLALVASERKDFIQRACRSPTGKLRERSNFARPHSPSIVEYAKSVCGSSD